MAAENNTGLNVLTSNRSDRSFEMTMAASHKVSVDAAIVTVRSELGRYLIT